MTGGGSSTHIACHMLDPAVSDSFLMEAYRQRAKGGVWGGGGWVGVRKSGEKSGGDETNGPLFLFSYVWKRR